MKNKKIILLLIITILLTGCSEKNEKKDPIQLVEVSSGGSTIYQNDNIKIKISDNIDEKESIYTSILNELQKIDAFSPIGNLEIQISKQYMVPNVDKIIKCDVKFIETEEFKKELIKKSYDIYDNWISEGLYAKIYNIEKEKTDFATYYVDNEFSLFGARFFEPLSSKEEIENIKSASIDLVEYMLENDKKEELLKNKINIEDIEKWAKDKSMDLTYQREIEYLMNPIEVYLLGDKFVINTKEEVNGFAINTNISEVKSNNKRTEQYNTAKKIEEIILRFDRDILAIRRAIENNAPKFYEKYKEVLNNPPKVEYNFVTDRSVGGLFFPGSKRIELGRIDAHAHEYIHFLFRDVFIDKGVIITMPAWLDEGVANYLDTVYCESIVIFYDEWYEYISNFIKEAESANLKDIESAQLYKNELEIYKRNGMDISDLKEVADNMKDDKSKRLLVNDVFILSTIKETTMTRGELEEYNVKLDKLYEYGNYETLDYSGKSMTYYKNQIFFNYLVEQYGLEKILYLHSKGVGELTYKEYFGKTFNELKNELLKYLKENINGIELIFGEDDYL